ncbi:MAG: hypothetical protein NAOJABEB_02969 [Steroidobacteraceae bacterium]|nr:hypothetical protein [Steroidobacteraceae bacterium]
MRLIEFNDTLIGEPLDYDCVAAREWRGACGCMLAAITVDRVVIRPGRRIYRFARPLPQPIYAVCTHGHEWVLSEADAARIMPRRVA